MGLQQLVQVLDPRRAVRDRDTHIKTAMMETDRNLTRSQYTELRLYINALRKTKVNEDLTTEERFSLGWINTYGISQAYRLDAEKLTSKIDAMIEEDASLKAVARTAWNKEVAAGSAEKTRLEGIVNLNDESKYKNMSERLDAVTEYIGNGGEDLSHAQYGKLRKVVHEFRKAAAANEATPEVDQRLRALKDYMAKEYYKLQRTSRLNVLGELKKAKKAKLEQKVEKPDNAVRVRIQLDINGKRYQGKGTVYPVGNYTETSPQPEEDKSPSSISRLGKGIGNLVRGVFSRSPDPAYVAEQLEDLDEVVNASDRYRRVSYTVSKLVSIAKNLPDAALSREEANKVGKAYRLLESCGGRIDLQVAKHEYKKAKKKLASIVEKSAAAYREQLDEKAAA